MEGPRSQYGKSSDFFCILSPGQYRFGYRIRFRPRGTIMKLHTEAPDLAIGVERRYRSGRMDITARRPSSILAAAVEDWPGLKVA